MAAGDASAKDMLATVMSALGKQKTGQRAGAQEASE